MKANNELKEYNYNVEYLSQATNTLPYGYIDKTICGIGATSLMIENEEDVIITTPTILLSVQKSEQYPNSRCAYNVLAVWGEVGEQEIKEYVSKCNFEGQPIKIMTTYDGLQKVEFLLDRCRLIIDESDTLLALTKGVRREAIDYLFKKAEEFKDTVTFMSATPISLEYLPKWVSEIDQVKMNWENTIQSKPILAERTYPYKSLREEFIKPLQEKGEMTVAGYTYKKVVVFVNSVTTIAKVIKECGLDKKECGVIAGDTFKNSNALNGVERYVNGDQPKYLFITSSGYSGLDLHCNESMNIVVSNTNKAYTMIDMLTDLKQAVSRNRDKTNPNYGTYIYIYNQSLFSVSKEELIEKMEKDYIMIERTIRNTNEMIADGIDYSISDVVQEYSLVNKETGFLEVNYNAFMADKYFILETRDQYTKGFAIQNIVGEGKIVEPIKLPKDVTYAELSNYFKDNHKNGKVDWGIHSTRTEWITIIESLYNLTKTYDTHYTRAKETIDAYGDDWQMMKLKVRRLFKKGETITRKEVTERLQKFYDNKGIIRKAKYSDVFEVFDERDIKMKKIDGTRKLEFLRA